VVVEALEVANQRGETVLVAELAVGGAADD
jgi:hypothetical protein